MELERRGLDYLPLSRNEINYLRFDDLLKCIITNKAKLVVNAAGFTGRPNVDACEKEKAETLRVGDRRAGAVYRPLEFPWIVDA